MTGPTARTARRRSQLLLALIGLIALGILAGVGGLAYLFLRGAPPPAVSLGSALPRASGPASTGGTVPIGSAGTVGTIVPGGADGTWTVDTTVGSFLDFSSSFVGYRVNETLAQDRANTAVGRTPQVAGTLVLIGSKITNVDVTADLTRLASDDDRRDGRLRDQAIETNTFPQATFHLTTPIDLGSAPADGATFTVSAAGELTLHGVTRQVTVTIEARLLGDVVTVTGSVDICSPTTQSSGRRRSSSCPSRITASWSSSSTSGEADRQKAQCATARLVGWCAVTPAWHRSFPSSDGEFIDFAQAALAVLPEPRTDAMLQRALRVRYPAAIVTVQAELARHGDGPIVWYACRTAASAPMRSRRWNAPALGQSSTTTVGSCR